MNIKEINIEAFGKFIDKKIELNNGINIIYGDNETGKSTIHKFIESLLFDFDLSTEYGKLEKKKYDPWFSNEYSGSVEIKDNRDYLVYRDFNKNVCKINDNEENTNEIDDFQQPGYQLFGINREIYKNTLSIGQLKSKTDKDLLKEIKDKIENLGRTKDQKISIDNVLEKLDQKKKTDKLETNESTIESKKNEKEEILTQKKEIKLFTNKIVETKNDLEILNSRNEELEPIVSIKNFDNFEKKYQDSSKVKKEIKELEDEIKSMKSDMNIEIEDYEELIVLSSKNEKLNDEKSELENDLTELEKEIIYIKNDFQKFKNVGESNFISQHELYKNNKKMLERLQVKLDNLKKEIDEINDKDYEGIIESYNQITRENKRRKYLQGILEGNIISLLKTKLKQERNIKWLKVIISLLIILGAPIGSYFAANYYNNINLYYLSGAAIFGVFLLSKLSRNNTLIRNIKKEIKEISEQSPKYKEECENLKENKENILEKYNCSNTKDLKSMYYDAIDNQKAIEEKNKTYETLEEEIFYLNKKCKEIEEFLYEYLNKFGFLEINEENIKSLNKKYNESEMRFNNLGEKEEKLNEIKSKKEFIEKEIDSNNKEVNKILSNSGVDSKDEFKEAFKIQSILKEKVSIKNNKEEILKNILDGDDYNSLKEKFEIITKIKEKENFTDFNEIKEEKLIVEEEIQKSKDKIDKNIDKIKKLENYRRLYLIEEEIQDLEREKDSINTHNNIVELAKENIIETSIKIKEEFMPELKKNLNKYFKILTGGKYEEINISDDFNITVKDIQKEDAVSINNLSLGTIDQIYFSLRFGLINLMFNSSEIPIILDDCFTQYDDERLKNALEIFSKIKEQYQIILFTCHKREVKILKELGADYNLINL